MQNLKKFINDNNLNGLYKSLYDGCGAKINKIIKSEIKRGSWTFNKVVNELNPQKDEAIIFITVKQVTKDYIKINYGLINHYGEYQKLDNRVSGLSAFYTKKDLEETRKDVSTSTIFLLFKNKDITGNTYVRPNGYGKIKRELHESYKNNRYIIKNIINGHSENLKKAYVSSADIQNKQYKNIEFIHFNNFLSIKDLPEDIINIFDKSGYFVLGYKEELHNKLRILKAKKEKEKVANQDFTEDIEEIEKDYKNIVNKYLDILKNENPLNENYKNILKDFECFVRWNFTSFPIHKHKILNKEYNTINEINSRLNDYKKYIKKQLEKLA